MSAKFALAALIAMAASASAAEPYPDHPVTLIVPYPKRANWRETSSCAGR
jgi:tripartite-type tricarboxylate transporter receptor subunit TctC